MVSVGKECRKTLFSGFTSGAVVCVVTCDGVGDVTGQSKKLI